LFIPVPWDEYQGDADAFYYVIGGAGFARCIMIDELALIEKCALCILRRVGSTAAVVR
jgi:hypothetical protein